MRLTTDRRRVAVGVDGSPNSLAALRRAAHEAEERRARLDVYAVVDGPATLADRVRAWLRLRDTVARVLPAAQHVTTRLHVGVGDPASVLVDASAAADVLVIGARLHSEEGSPLGGAVVPRVVGEAACAVFVCADQSAARHAA